MSVLYAEIPENLKSYVVDKAKKGSISQALFITAMISYCKEHELEEAIIEHYDDVFFTRAEF